MLLDRYDFYDLHAVLVAVRSNPCAEYNAEILRLIQKYLEKPQETNSIEPNGIRSVVRKCDSIDKERFHWVLVDNAYTYGHRVEKEPWFYDLLCCAFRLLWSCAEAKDHDRLYDLADAFHNIPIPIADGCRNFKKACKTQFGYYNKKYQTDLWKELMRP